MVLALRFQLVHTPIGRSATLPPELTLFGLAAPEERADYLAGPDPSKCTGSLRQCIRAHLGAAARAALYKDAKANSPRPCGSGKKHKKCCLGKFDKDGYPVAAPGEHGGGT